MSKTINRALRLTGMTLRGIGSYLQGARLEIRPITVLCGTNGSGKSTWFKTLNMLSRSLQNGFLPFSFDVSDADFGNLELMNSKAYAEFSETPDWLEGWEEFGPVGTIGLEFIATEGDGPPGVGAPWRFLVNGSCAAKTKFRLRISHPEHFESLQAGMEDLIELRVNSELYMRLRKPRRLIRWRPDRERNVIDQPYLLQCSRSFMAPGTEDSTLVDAARVEYLGEGRINVLSADGSAASASEQQLAQLCVQRIQELLKEVLAGFFYIGAIRRVQEISHIRDLDALDQLLDQEAAIERRYVGPGGEASIKSLRQATGFHPFPPSPASITTIVFERVMLA